MANTRKKSTKKTYVRLYSRGALVWSRTLKTAKVKERLRLLGAYLSSTEGSTENWYMKR